MSRIGRSGYPFLCTFGKPYNLGVTVPAGLSVSYTICEMKPCCFTFFKVSDNCLSVFSVMSVLVDSF
ncbi:unnamed protein product [Heterobilharzia americana]|nr:unnamed protein product [Heterobilharzia americana]